MGKSVFYQPDEKFLSFVRKMKEECENHSTEWEVNAPMLAALATKLATAEEIQKVNTNKAKHTSVTQEAKSAAFKDLRAYASVFATALRGNLKISDANLKSMGLQPRKREARQPKPRPTEMIIISVFKILYQITIRAKRPDSDQVKGSVGPKHHHGFIIEYWFDEGEHKTFISTRLKHTMDFTPADRAKTLHVRAAWVNARLQEGPWCEEITVLIG